MIPIQGETPSPKWRKVWHMRVSEIEKDEGTD